MPAYKLPKTVKPKKLKRKQVYLLASGDLRPSANKQCWPTQAAMEKTLAKAVKEAGYTLVRAHTYNAKEKHGFISSQKQGMDIFAKMDPKAPVIVAESVWQYSHHVLPGLTTHQGPICTIANWSGTWPGLVGMLNLNGSMTKAGVKYSTLWAEDFSDEAFLANLRKWLKKGSVTHRCSHVKPIEKVEIPAAEARLGKALAAQLKREKAIMGIFDEGCMGMFNAIIPDPLLHATGVFKERLSQSALCWETNQVKDSEAKAVFKWLKKKGVDFKFGPNPKKDLTQEQVLTQCKMYIAVMRIADDFGCDLVGIQYQQGLKDMLPASDLVEGMLNNKDRPQVKSRDGKRVLYRGQPLPHYNEVDECAGLDALINNRVLKATGQPVETTLHDVRWGDWDKSGTTDEYVWVFQISGAVPPAHLKGGWKGVTSYRQPPMFFRLGGGTVAGTGKPGEMIWSRIYIENDQLNMDIGRAEVIKLPEKETERRRKACTYEWPVVHAVTYGVTRDQFMAKHKANHIQVAYARDAEAADKVVLAKAAMAAEMGIKVNFCGKKKDGSAW